jgi:hypothetical protein
MEVGNGARKTEGVAVALFRRNRHGAGRPRAANSADVAHLTQFVKTRTGVEAYLEPRTAVTETTVVLVASTGEWTRRRVPGPKGAQDFSHKHAIPLYDVGVVGYPRRMRDWTERRKQSGQTGLPESGPQ